MKNFCSDTDLLKNYKVDPLILLSLVKLNGCSVKVSDQEKIKFIMIYI